MADPQILKDSREFGGIMAKYGEVYLGKKSHRVMKDPIMESNKVGAKGWFLQLRLEKKKIASIGDIKGLGEIPDLEALYLWGNQINEISGLENLRNLKFLFLWGNQIGEIKGLDNLQNLLMLHLSGNHISEITGLEHLTNLEHLDLSSNSIREIKGLETLTNLDFLNLQKNQITELKGLNTLANLNGIMLAGNPLEPWLQETFGKVKFHDATIFSHNRKAQELVKYCQEH